MALQDSPKRSIEWWDKWYWAVAGGALVLWGLGAEVRGIALVARHAIDAIQNNGTIGLISQEDGAWLLGGFATHAVGLIVMGLWAASVTGSPDPATDLVAQQQRFDRHLALLGLYMVSVVLTSSVAVGTLMADHKWLAAVCPALAGAQPPASPATPPAEAGRDPAAQAAGHPPTNTAAPATAATPPARDGQISGKPAWQPAWRIAALFLLAITLSLAGALFFVANRLSTKRAQEPFCVTRFWSGLFIYMGEAALLTMVVFFVFVGQIAGGAQAGADGAELGNAIYWLPALGLTIGMLIQSAEALIFGVADGVLHRIRAALGWPGASSETTGGTPPVAQTAAGARRQPPQESGTISVSLADTLDSP